MFPDSPVPNSLEDGLKIKLILANAVPAPKTFLSPRELEKLASFKIEKRRRDWLGGRYAAKTLLRDRAAAGKALGEIEITYDACGRPEWAGKPLSISHSGPYCAAACGPEAMKFLGMDIEKAEPRAAAWYADYFHKSELPSPDMNQATRLWTIKEALLKALGLGLKADPLDIHLSGETPEFSRAALARHKEMGSPGFKLTTFGLGKDYFLSLAWQKPEKE
jgi:4'-phosphopantetheinyl transferase